MASNNAPCLPLKLEIRFRKNLSKLTRSAVRINSKKPKGKKTMKEKKEEEVATLGYESSCTPNFSEKVRPLITGPWNHYAEYVSKLIAEVFFPATHTV